MSFQRALAELLEASEAAIAVLFVDDTGEMVDMKCADTTPYPMKVTGAYAGLYVRHFSDLMKGSSLGDLEFIHVERAPIHLHIRTLPDGYTLVLVQRGSTLIASARAAMERARDAIVDDLFPESREASA